MATSSCAQTALVILSMAVVVAAAQAPPPPYRDRSRPVEMRVADLLARMTIEEKVAQLQGIWNRKAQMQAADGRFDPEKARPLLGLGLGQVSRPGEIGGPRDRSPRDHAEFTNAIQKWVKTVAFTAGPDALSPVNRQMQHVVEPGRFEMMVGTSSSDLTRAGLEVVAR